MNIININICLNVFAFCNYISICVIIFIKIIINLYRDILIYYKFICLKYLRDSKLYVYCKDLF